MRTPSKGIGKEFLPVGTCVSLRVGGWCGRVEVDLNIMLEGRCATPQLISSIALLGGKEGQVACFHVPGDNLAYCSV